MKLVSKIYLRLQKIHRDLENKKRSKKGKIFLSKMAKPYQLHIGCGKVKLEKWINMDLEIINGVTDICWDASQKFAFIEDNTCQLIYNEHFLEHLTIDQAKIFLSECFRVLKKKGILRIAMPSLEYTIKKYCSEDWKDQDWLTWKEHKFIQTRAEMLNIAMRWWGHQWLYDREELHRRLKEAGFEIIRDVEWGHSEIPELRNLETRKDSILICEAIKQI